MFQMFQGMSKLNIFLQLRWESWQHPRLDHSSGATWKSAPQRKLQSSTSSILQPAMGHSSFSDLQKFQNISMPRTSSCSFLHICASNEISCTVATDLQSHYWEPNSMQNYKRQHPPVQK